MRAAIVLTSDTAALAQQAGEIDAVLKNLHAALSGAELWLLGADERPAPLPRMSCSFAAVKRFAVGSRPVPESYLAVLEPLCRDDPIDLLLFDGDGLGAELATRLAYRLNGSACLQVTTCSVTAGRPEVTKPAYGNHLTARMVLERAPYCLSVAKQPSRPVQLLPAPPGGAECIASEQPAPSWIKTFDILPDPPRSGLRNADLVLVMGHGVKNQATADALQRIAASIGAALGASRPVVMNAWTDMERLIGASGLILAPKVCIVAGVSGTGVFQVGIRNSEFIAAINTDRQAPIFESADVGIVGDLLEVLSELEKVIQAAKTTAKHAEQ